MGTPHAPTADVQREDTCRHTHVSGGGEVRLHVVDTGNPTGRPIVFIHGFSQSWLTWRLQLRSR